MFTLKVHKRNKPNKRRTFWCQWKSYVRPNTWEASSHSKQWWPLQRRTFKIFRGWKRLSWLYMNYTARDVMLCNGSIRLKLMTSSIVLKFLRWKMWMKPVSNKKILFLHIFHKTCLLRSHVKMKNHSSIYIGSIYLNMLLIIMQRNSIRHMLPSEQDIYSVNFSMKAWNLQ
jgi:hypothetical protein